MRPAVESLGNIRANPIGSIRGHVVNPTLGTKIADSNISLLPIQNSEASALISGSFAIFNGYQRYVFVAGSFSSHH